MLKFQKVMGYDFVNNSMSEFVDEMHERVQKEQKTFIVTANPEIVTYANTHPYYDKVLKQAQYIIPDGIGITIASKLLGNPLQERITGFDFMTELLHIANQNKYKVYFLGTEPDVIGLTVQNIQLSFPDINIVGYHHGFFKDDEPIIKEIKRTEPDIVFLGLGFPKQEEWIASNKHHFNKGLFIGLGGCFNVWAGVVNRAPELWRNLNLEWAYRIMKEPARLKRAVAIPQFMLRVINRKYRKATKKNVSKI
ncbi:WecB/TagA/CpsF family glycosyltransferase [Bacillus sp. JJ1533]|uniref:WecB/TagA/CpsF family glycosyltransferase n=1 Tax=Bacillus sp. JJ1533 TaxID=3122959 RepID=UPI002FFF19F5